MADNSRIRWGILGTATIARAALIPALQASRNAEVVALASRDTERAFGIATRFGIPSSYGSYDALLADPAVDAVYVPLPNALHAPWTLRAIAAGKHVLCEKPLGVSAAECLSMAEAAGAQGVKLMEAFMYRFHPQIDALVTLIDEGAIGELRHMHASFTFRLARPDNIRLQPELGGGALMDVGCYCVNLFRTVMGEEPLEGSAMAHWHPNGVDEQLSGTLRFANGVMAQFDCGLNMARRETFLAAGAEGVIELPRAFLPVEQPTTILLRRGYSEADHRTIAGVDAYRLMVEHFSECIFTDTAPLFDAHEAAQNMRVIESLYRSAAAGGASVTIS